METIEVSQAWIQMNSGALLAKVAARHTLVGTPTSGIRRKLPKPGIWAGSHHITTIVLPFITKQPRTTTPEPQRTVHQAASAKRSYTEKVQVNMDVKPAFMQMRQAVTVEASQAWIQRVNGR